MITRQQYIDTPELHHEFYSQFVTDATFQFIKANIGLEKLQASDCPHLNDVVRWERGGQTWLWDHTPVNQQRIKDAGESLTMSVRTCVGKAAARILLKEAAET